MNGKEIDWRMYYLSMFQQDAGGGGGGFNFYGYPILALEFDTVQQTPDCLSAYWFPNSSMNLLSQKNQLIIKVMNIVKCLTANTNAKAIGNQYLNHAGLDQRQKKIRL